MHAKLAPERDSAISDDERVSAAGRTSSTDLPPTDARRSWRSSSSVLPENMQPVITWTDPARFISAGQDIRDRRSRGATLDAQHGLTCRLHARSCVPLPDLLLLSLGGRGSFRLTCCAADRGATCHPFRRPSHFPAQVRAFRFTRLGARKSR